MGPRTNGSIKKRAHPLKPFMRAQECVKIAVKTARINNDEGMRFENCSVGAGVGRTAAGYRKGFSGWKLTMGVSPGLSIKCGDDVYHPFDSWALHPICHTLTGWLSKGSHCPPKGEI